MLSFGQQICVELWEWKVRLLFVPFKLYLVPAKHALEKSNLAVKSFSGLFVVNKMLGLLILNMLLKTHDFFWGGGAISMNIYQREKSL